MRKVICQAFDKCKHDMCEHRRLHEVERLKFDESDDCRKDACQNEKVRYWPYKIYCVGRSKLTKAQKLILLTRDL